MRCLCPKPQFQSVVILSYNRKNDRNEHKTEKEKAPDLGLFQWLRGRFSSVTQKSISRFCLAGKCGYSYDFLIIKQPDCCIIATVWFSFVDRKSFFWLIK